MIVKGLDLVTVVIPPALPVAMTVGISFALHRLKQEQVYCTSPPRINIAGKLNLICFDKVSWTSRKEEDYHLKRFIWKFHIRSSFLQTGTLTESDLGVLGVIPSVDGVFDLPLSSNVPHTTSRLLQCLVSCHRLSHAFIRLKEKD